MKTRERWAGWIAGAALMLGGCTLSNVSRDYAPDTRSGEGVVVMSLGRTGAAEFDLYAVIKPVHGSRPFTIAVDNNETPKDFGKVVIPPPGSQASDWGYVPSSTPLERLVVASLPAGDYLFSQVTGIAPRFSGSAPSRFSVRSDPPGLRFTVRPGQITYLGSAVFGFPDWLPLARPIGPLRVITADKRERDAGLVRERFPGLGPDLPQPSLIGADGSHEVRYYLLSESDGGAGKL